MERSKRGKIVAAEKRINEGLRRFYTRTKYEQTTESTPLDALLAAEDDTPDDWATRRETAVAIMAWLVADGPHPAKILRRLYLMGDHMMIEPFCLLTVREKGALMLESHETNRWLMKRIITDPLRRKGARSINGAGQKGLCASAAASAAQQRNTNRAKGATAARKSRRRNACSGPGSTAGLAAGNDAGVVISRAAIRVICRGANFAKVAW